MKYDKYTDVMESTGQMRLISGSYTDGKMTNDYEITERWYEDMNQKTGMWLPECVYVFTHISIGQKCIPIFDETLFEDQMEAYNDSIKNGCIF